MISYVLFFKVDLSTTPISLPFMLRHELNAERIMGEVQRVLKSNEQVSLQEGMQVHLVHVGMPQGGVASRKRKHYGFKLSKFLDNKHSVLRIKNKDFLCLARALVTDIARQEHHPDWNTIRQGCTLQGILAQDLHKKACVPEGFFPKSPNAKHCLTTTKSSSCLRNISTPLSTKVRGEKNKFICIITTITLT